MNDREYIDLRNLTRLRDIESLMRGLLILEPRQSSQVRKAERNIEHLIGWHEKRVALASPTQSAGEDK